MTGNLPCYVESESAVLGAALLDPEGKGVELATELTPAHFYASTNSIVAEAMASIVARREVPDVVTVMAELQRMQVKSIDSGRLSELANDGSPVGWKQNIARLRSAYSLRRLVSEASSAIDRAMALEEPQGLIGALTERLVAISVGSPDATKDMAQVTDSVRQELANRKSLDPRPRGVLFGIDRLDWLTTGIKPTKLCVIAGATGGGKTSLALQAAFRFAESGGSALVFSLEMTSNELCERAVAQAELIDSADLAMGKISPDTWQRIDRRLDALSKVPILIEDTLRSVNDITARACSWRARNPDVPAVIVVDFLQLLRGGNPKEMRYRQVGESAENLKALAKQLNVAVLLLSQLSRTMEPKAAPTMNMIKESGCVENAADCVICLHNPSKTQDGEMSIYVLKNRGGRTGETPAHFTGKHFLFSNASDVF